MKQTIALLTALMLLVSFQAVADDHEKTKKIIVKDGEVIEGEDVDFERIEEILKEVNVEVEDTGDMRIFVTKTDDGEVKVEKLMGKGGHWVGKMGDAPMHMMGEGPHRIHMMKHRAPRAVMSKDAGNCVLKNIKNASTEAAAKAVVRACQAMHPAPAPEADS